MPRPRRYFAAIPSRRVTRRHYAEQLDWWAASGWVMEIEDGEDGTIWLHTAKIKGRRSSALWGATATPEEVATPQLTRSFLTAALYLHLHPRKARAVLAATGQVCNQAELSAFIRAQRRKVGKPHLSKS
jgi:hypothetical protein